MTESHTRDEFVPRASQQAVLAYKQGKMGISAVPGSGKTHTLAVLAAQLVAEQISDDQEVLVVTLVNSAVDNFRRRINRLITQRGLLPNYGYRVRTLHGLAHDIVRERPALVGLAEDFGIIDEREADAVREDAVEAWLRAHPDAAEAYLSAEVEGGRVEWIKRNRWPGLVRDVAAAFIKRAKDLQRTPDDVLTRIEAAAGAGAGGEASPFRHLDMARIGASIYVDYQRSLAYRGVVDFDDLIRLALQALHSDPEYLTRLRHRWPYILEDEAQDSSQLQQDTLQLLAGEEGNWVRVGDPNQAIYETFTTADPQLLLDFVGRQGDVQARQLPESGRSQPAIIDLANTLIDWVRNEHPTPGVRKALALPHIRPTPPGDPQPNPPADPGAVQLVDREFTPDAEMNAVADSIERWIKTQAGLSPEAQATCAVLVPRNARGFEVIDYLGQRNIPYVELLRSTSVTRQTAGALGNILRALADPVSGRKLAAAFRVWRRADLDDPDTAARVEAAAREIHRCTTIEAYLWPRAGHDWLAALQADRRRPELQLIQDFRDVARRWHGAASLPIDQLVLTLAGEIFGQAAELALAHKLAGLLRDATRTHPTYRLPELVEELAVIARNERRFLGFSEEESGFEAPKGMVTVATVHKSKGLEWDRVYLMSVNNYDYPAGSAHDTYISEPWFIRDHLNLVAEALAQLKAVSKLEPGRLEGGESARLEEGTATRQARLDYVAERLRLLYVGITRARKELIITWNTGGRRVKMQPAVAFLALQDRFRAGDDG
ncbi:MAG: ATP-dependent helicase [Anaerolineae bacterium]|nr:ATP-dependent helicase [Anaerolineae bacterium]